MIQTIAEIAGGHVGELEKAIKLIELSNEGDADIIKFQFYKADELCEEGHPDYELFKSLEFSIEQWKTIFAKASSFDLKIYADVFGEDSFSEAKELDVDGYKIHSADLDNINLISKIATLGKTLLLGVGGRKRVEIYSTVKYLKENFDNLEIILMVGHQTFPTPVSEHNLNEINWFSRAYRDLDVKVGVADHIDGDLPIAMIWPLTALGAGACVVEKHITIDRKLKLEDYESAIDVADFKNMVAMIKQLETSIDFYPKWTSGREQYRKKGVKVPFANADLGNDSELSNEKINYLRPLDFCNPIGYHQFKNKKTVTTVKAGQKISWENINNKVGILVNARSASQRLPQKALKKICGKETILLVLERMSSCQAGEIVFCTTTREDDNELAELVAKNGYEVFRGPDKDVAKRLLLTAEKYNFDHIVRITGDDLLRDIELIDKAVSSHLENCADYTDMLEMVYSCGTEIISTRALKCIVERAADNDNTEYLSWYLDDETAFVQNRIEVPEVYKRDYRLTLDTEEDFELLTKIHEELYTDGNPVKLQEAIDYLDNNQNIASINKTITSKLNRTELNLEMKI